ncbi:MAG: hypothetical protein MUC63_09935 [Planctomycetes bacterium]|nr:hypothetical protein [Planctomycetota bacterium]
MRDVLFLSWRYVAFHKGKSALLAASLTLTIWLPFAAHLLTARVEARMTARADATPLVVGTRGSSFDLALHALYFRGRVPGAVPMSEVRRIADTGLASPVPLHLRYTARGFPLVGTSLEYFARRGLALRSGTLPIRLGDCVAGAQAARKLRLAPGGRLPSDPENVFDIAGSYPVDMRVTGVLEESGSPDDAAVFADVKTAWVVEGLGHGHEDLAREEDPGLVLERKEGHVVASAALPNYTRITDENLPSFHFHGDPDTFPLTAILVWPRDGKSATILRGRYLGPEERVQILVPATVVSELMGVVFRIRRFFDAYFGFVLAADLLFLTLIVLLSLQLRRRERTTMFKIGCGRATIFLLQAGELAFILGFSVALAAALAGAAAALAPGLADLALS